MGVWNRPRAQRGAGKETPDQCPSLCKPPPLPLPSPPPARRLTGTQSDHHPLVGALALPPCPEAALPEGGLVAPAGHVVEPGLHLLSGQWHVLGGTHGMPAAQLPADHRRLGQRPLLVAHVPPRALVSDQHHSITRTVSVCQPQVTLSACRQTSQPWGSGGEESQLRGDIFPDPPPRPHCESSAGSQPPPHRASPDR